MEDIYSLLQPYSRYPNNSAEYVDKMIHDVPRVAVVDRHQFILNQCEGKRVVNFGSASGELHEKIKKVASSTFGIDKIEPADYLVNLDDPFYSLHGLVEADIYVVGEVIEHLSNPGAFLERLRAAVLANGAKNAQIIFTVPNAFSQAAQKSMVNHVENVNIDHVAWYSYTTIQTLLKRFKYAISGMKWYNGKPFTAEGLIVIAKV